MGISKKAKVKNNLLGVRSLWSLCFIQIDVPNPKHATYV